MGRLGECHDSEMIGLGMSDRGGCHIAQDQVRFASKRNTQPQLYLWRTDVAGEENRPGNRIEFNHVERNHESGRSDTGDCDLRPATWCSSQINNPRARLQQSVLVIELREFECGTATIPRRFGFGNVGIVDLPREPSSG